MTYLYTHKIKDKSKMALIMCTYIRFENLAKTYDSLSDQTNNNFDFYICDNSNNDPHLLNTSKKKSKFFKNNVFIKEYNNKYSIFSRFFLARELAKEGYEIIIFIDDDQIVDNEFIEKCYNQYEENSIKSFYAHYITGDYWKKEPCGPNDEVNYLGGGGLMCNSDLFLDEKFFSCPEEYWILDDLWLSYYVANFTDYKMKKLNAHIKFINDHKATAKGLKEMKRKFSDKYILNGRR